MAVLDYPLDKLIETRQNVPCREFGATVEGRVEDSERHLWMALAGIFGFVFVLLIAGPVMRAYKGWKIRRMHRARRLMHADNRRKSRRSDVRDGSPF